MNTLGENEKIKNFGEEFFRKENEEKNKMENMLSDTDYIKWLEKFTLEHSGFTDEDWLYFPEKITKEDLEKVNDFHLMYNGIEEYACKNYIYPTSSAFGKIYKIKLDNTGFELGKQVGQGTRFFCNIIEIKEEKDFIDFNDVINNNKRDNVLYIENKLNDLSNYIIYLYENGIPLEAIEDTLNDTINKINSKNNLSQPKVLKRK